VLNLKTVYGSDYTPPIAKGFFAEVPVTFPFTPWVEEFYACGTTAGCNAAPLSYCPSEKIMGEFFSVFLNRAFSQP
jgi:hypothetical protein